MRVAAFLATALLVSSVAFAQVPDISTAQLEALPKAPTQMVAGGKEGKATAGDVVELVITPPAEDADGAQPVMAEKLASEPVEWGGGRILWWKAAVPGKGEIHVGVTTYKPGPFEIAPIPFTKGGKPVFASQSQTVEFSSVGGDKSKDDIYPPTSVAFPIWVWIVLGLLALAIVLAAIYYIKKWNDRRKSAVEELARAPRILTPIEEFEKTRSQVDEKRLVEKATFKPHYFALSDAAKKFLGRAYRFDAEERTTRELVRELESLGLTDDLIDKWEKIFDEMDITKFTDQLPERDAALSLSARLSQLVAASYRVSPVAKEALVVQK